MRLFDLLQNSIWRHQRNIEQGDNGGQPLDEPGPDPSTPPPPPPPPPPGNGYGGSNYGQQRKPPPPPPNPFEGVPQDRITQITQLADQWNMATGFAFKIPDWAMKEMMTSAHVMSLYDFGQYMFGHMQGAGHTGGAYFIPADYAASYPWAQYGLDETQYHGAVMAFDNTFMSLTGQAATQDLIDQALHVHQGQMTGPQFQTWLLSQDKIKNTYGWLKYGLDFNQFQTQKLQMRTQFGRDLDNSEAVTQLQYLHSASGPNMAVQVNPTFSQQEKRQAQIGPTQSEVR